MSRSSALIALPALALSTLAAYAVAGETEKGDTFFDVYLEVIEGEAVKDGGITAEDDWESPLSKLTSYDGSETEAGADAAAKAAGPGTGSGSNLVNLNGDFLNADLDSARNTYGVGQTASGDGYFAKVSAGGQLIWDIQFTSSGEVVAHDVSVNQDDDAYVAVTAYYPSVAAATQSYCTVFQFDTSTGFVIGSRSINGGTGLNECTRVYARDSMDTYYTAGHFAGAGWMIIGYGYYGMNQLPHQSFWGGWNDVYEIVDVNEDAHGNMLMAINVDNGADSDIAVITYEAGVLNPYSAASRVDYGAAGDEDVATGFTVSRHELPHLSGVSEVGGQLLPFHKQISVTTVQTRTEATREF